MTPDDFRVLLEAVSLEASSPERAALFLDRAIALAQRFHSNVFWGDRLLTLDKAAGFLNDPRFSAALSQASSSTGQNQYASPDGISWRFNTLIWAARSCLALPGDFVECGVYRGDMTWMITETVDLKPTGKQFYLYDTFSGFDPRYSSAADFPTSSQFFELAQASYADPTIEAHVRQRFSDKPYVQITRGSVPDILRECAPAQIAFLHLDMNSPAAELGALEVLFDRIVAGAVIIFDDYGWAVFHKQRQAADQFAHAQGDFIMEMPTGQGLMVKR